MSERPTVALRDLLTEKRDRVALKDGVEYPVAGVYGFGRGLLLRDAVTTADVAAPHLFRIHEGQVIYSRLKAFEGAFTVVPAWGDGRFVSNEFPTFDVDGSRCLPGYLELLLSQPQTWADLAARITGVGARRERLQVDDFLDFEIALPQVDEQQQIWEYAATLSSLIDAQQRESETRWTVLASITEDLLATVYGWEQLPDAWELRTLADVSDIRSGITKGRRTNEPLQPVPFIRAANVQSGFLDLREIKPIEVTTKECDRFALEDGDVLLIEGGNAEHLGRGWIWDAPITPCVHQNHVFRARPNRDVISPRFLAYAINASPARAYCLEHAKRTTNLASINKTQISELPVPIPPLAEQFAIVTKLDVLRAAAIASQRAAEAAAAMRTALVTELVTGDRAVPAGSA